jgi:hypothetical protein
MKTHFMIKLLNKMNIQEHPDSDKASGEREFINTDGEIIIIPYQAFKSIAHLMLYLIDRAGQEGLDVGYKLGKPNY